MPRKEYRSKIIVQPAGHFVVGWFLSKHSAKPKACFDTLLLKFVSWPSSRNGLWWGGSAGWPNFLRLHTSVDTIVISAAGTLHVYSARSCPPSTKYLYAVSKLFNILRPIQFCTILLVTLTHFTEWMSVNENYFHLTVWPYPRHSNNTSTFHSMIRALLALSSQPHCL